jgi:hypothetical protein
MNEALTRMLARYESRNIGDYIRAFREILQELALLGLWRGKFFEKAAFYGGTSLRIIYGMDRFSEDLDFSLIKPQSDFDLSRYLGVLEREIASFGFDVRLEKKDKTTVNPIQSAFLKGDTLNHLLPILDSLTKFGVRGRVRALVTGTRPGRRRGTALQKERQPCSVDQA